MKLRARLTLIALPLLALAAAFVPTGASALSGSEFQAGRIIDDAVFYDSNSMSVAQIQSFLNSKVPSCDTNGTQPYYGTYGGRTYNGNIQRKDLDARYPAPYTCLRDYVENPTTRENNLNRSGTAINGGKSAAQIIYDESKLYNINPKVLLVMIQKESIGGLLTDDWPWPNQYKTVLGYGCPDTAACDSDYFGFYNQVHNAARQFRIYANNPTSYRYKLGVNNVLYSPTAGCGTQSVNIGNIATLSLYIYTPYTPNQAALNNLYGTGDGCSAYGNRNFWRMFNDYFGSTFTPAYAWDIVSQTYSSGVTTIRSTDKVTLTLKAKNTGTSTWRNNGENPVRLGTAGPNDRGSAFYDPSWSSAVRPAQLTEASVAPGETGTFTFTVQAPAAGSYTERFNLVAENVSWFKDPGMYFSFTVTPSGFSTQYQSDTIPATLTAGASPSVTVTLKNTSSTTLYKTGSAIPKLGFYGRDSSFADSSWPSAARAAIMNETSVAPGQNATFTFKLKGPASDETLREDFRMVVEGWAWADGVFTKQIQMIGPYSATTPSQTINVTIPAGDYLDQTVTYTNNGTATWQKSGGTPMRLGAAGPYGRSSSRFAASTWSADNRAGGLNETSVAPGNNGTFGLRLRAPMQPGTYSETFAPVAEGVAWTKTPVTYVITVVAPSYGWQQVSQTATTAAVSPGQVQTVSLVAKNTGNITWRKSASDSFPVRLATSSQRDRTSSFYDTSWLSRQRPAALTEDNVAPGQNGTFTFKLVTPGSGSTYHETFNLIAEGVAWFGGTDAAFDGTITKDYAWQLVSKTYGGGSSTMSPLGAKTVSLTAKNTGNSTWFNTGGFVIKLATTSPRDRLSRFYATTWPSGTRAAVLQETSVAPGQNGTFSFTVNAPALTGTYNESFSLIAEGYTWLNDPGAQFTFIVQ